jgi:hypothetical protein
MIFEALEILADQNELDDRDPALQTVKTPVWAAKIRDAVNDALSTDREPSVTVTPELADYANESLTDAAASAQEGGRYTPIAWHNLISGAYAQYLKAAGEDEADTDFSAEALATMNTHELDATQVISFLRFQQGREFEHVSALPPEYEHLAEGINVTDYCVTYPGPNLLGYDPQTGEAWFQDYKEEFRGPLEEIERKFYLWAIVESDLTA